MARIRATKSIVENGRLVSIAVAFPIGRYKIVSEFISETPRNKTSIEFMLTIQVRNVPQLDYNTLIYTLL